jgi:hypothetical protein
MSTFTLIKQENRRKKNESQRDYKFRLINIAIDHLRNIEERTPKQEEEYEKACWQYLAFKHFDNGGVSSSLVEGQCKNVPGLLHSDLVEKYGNDTPLKRVLIERLVSAYTMAMACDEDYLTMMFHSSYDGSRTINSELGLKNIKEFRQGIEMANRQILELAQALENINRPNVTVNATHAYVANVQQVNTTPQNKDPAKDLESEIITAK